MPLTTFHSPLKLHNHHEQPPFKLSSRFFITNSQKPDCNFSTFFPPNQSVAAVVFGEASQRSRLHPLTKRRSECAIPIAGSYRLIDAVISNCINSNITKIYALTQFNSTSLNSHLLRAYSGGLLANQEFLEVIAAYQSPVGISFYDRDFPVYTLPRHLPPSLVTNANITDSVIGDGCILNRCSIRNTVIGPRTRVGDGAVIEDSVIMGSDIYQSVPEQRIGGGDGKHESIPIGIGEGSFIRKAIIDKNAKIGKNVKIINRDNVLEGNNETDGYIITSGIIVVVRGAVFPDGSIL